MALSASKLRENIYRLLDETIKTGKALEIVRRGHRLRIVPEKPASRLDRLVKRPCIRGDPEDLVHMDWSKEWRP